MHRSPATQPARKKTGAVQSQRVKGKVVIRVPQPRKVTRARLRRPLRPPLRVHHHLQPHQLLHLHLRQTHNTIYHDGQAPNGSANR